MEATRPHFDTVHAKFIYDAERQDSVFVEVNPRIWVAAFLMTAAEINLPDRIVRMAMREEVTPAFDYRTDVVTMTSR